MKNLLKNGERIEDLLRDDLKIIQNHSKYCFSLDSVLLSDYAKVKNNDRVIELCSGSGVVSILMNAKYHPKYIEGWEIDDELFDMSRRSVEINSISNITFVNKDIKEILKGYKEFDVVVCNPPYYKREKDEKNISQKNLLAKYEVNISLEEIVLCASKLLNNKGKLYMVYPTKRLQELMFYTKENNLICKDITIIKESKNNSLGLFTFVKNANEGLKLN